MLINKLFYTFKPVIPRSTQIFFRRLIIRNKLAKKQSVWPIDPKAGICPPGWKGWPDGKRFGLILSHDVDTQRGHDSVLKLAELESDMGFLSSFNFVPERYHLSLELIDELHDRGFGIGAHGLKHDGKLFWNKKIFAERAVKINQYMKAWRSRGFTAPSMHNNLSWMHMLDIDFATSTFDTDPFEPIPEGGGTIYPFWVPGKTANAGYVELPYTLPQDFTLFVLMKEKNNSIWKRKLDWIAEKGGMALLNTHPDYMNFGKNSDAAEQYSVELYRDFISYIKANYSDQYWTGLPQTLARFLTLDGNLPSCHQIQLSQRCSGHNESK
jgi:hypothetical protein